MAALFAATSGLVTLAAATAKTVIEIDPSAYVQPSLVEIDISSSYKVSGTPVYLLAELMFYSATGTGTSGTMRRVGPTPSLAASTAYKTNLTVEPTGPVTLAAWDLILPSSPFVLQYPYGREIAIPASGFWGIRLTADVACSARVNLFLEE